MTTREINFENIVGKGERLSIPLRLEILIDNIKVTKSLKRTGAFVL